MINGDLVRIIMTRNNLFPPFQLGCSFEAIYRGGPNGAGDTFKLKTQYCGTLFQVNANCSEFVGFVELGPYQP